MRPHLWLIGGDERELAHLAQHMKPDGFEMSHWFAKGEKDKQRPTLAPKGTTHILLLSTHCYNVMAKSGRAEARRLKLPFASAGSHAEMVETLAAWGFPRKLRAPRHGELEAIVRANVDQTHGFFGDHKERKAEATRLHEIVQKAGLSSPFESVRGCLNKLRNDELERVKQSRRDKERAKREEEERRAKEEIAARERAEKAREAPKAERPRTAHVLDQVMSDLRGCYDRLATIASNLDSLQALQGKLEAVTKERDDLKARLDLVREGLTA